jgi:hypothetical protein
VPNFSEFSKCNKYFNISQTLLRTGYIKTKNSLSTALVRVVRTEEPVVKPLFVYDALNITPLVFKDFLTLYLQRLS